MCLITPINNPSREVKLGEKEKNENINTYNLKKIKFGELFGEGVVIILKGFVREEDYLWQNTQNSKI